MSKQSGLGDAFFVHGYDLSGDVNAVNKISGGPALLDFTTINKSAYVRQGGERSGEIDFTSFFDPSGSGPYTAGPAPLQTLPRTDVIVTYCRGTTLQNPAACMVAKQIGFDPTRGTDGSLTLSVTCQSNGYGLEWGEQLTAGLRTDGAATTGSAVDDTAGTSLGGQAYFQLTSFSGTSVTIDIQSATSSGGSYSSTGLTTSAMTAVGAQRLATSGSTTINRYLKVITTGTFSNAVFLVVFVRNATAVTF